MTKVTAIICPNCKDKIYSCARHDFRTCTCGETSIDGGFDYFRTVTKDFSKTEFASIKIDATQEELFQDWRVADPRKFGLIKGNK